MRYIFALVFPLLAAFVIKCVTWAEKGSPTEFELKQSRSFRLEAILRFLPAVGLGLNKASS